mmetsp:Transcript_8058/g.20150  ORF Transcript_8058/g.20150 Transcript_8058/m.20150 type:complete len:682 (-) Transcript_8058:428-2473(-)
MEDENEQISWADALPDEIAFSIAQNFEDDAKSLLRLGKTCRFWRGMSKDEQVWQHLVERRFGDDYAPAEPLEPLTLPGWTFFQGMAPRRHREDPQGEDAGGGLAGRGMHKLRLLAAVADSQEEAKVFTTSGLLYQGSMPAHWSLVSFAPGEGCYVRTAHEKVVQDAIARAQQRAGPRAGLPVLPPAPAPPTSTDSSRGATTSVSAVAPPPQFAGWVFYPCVESPGWDLLSPHDAPQSWTLSQGGAAESEVRTAAMQLGSHEDVMGRCRSLPALAEVAASNARAVVAFTTSGCLKTRVAHPRSWVPAKDRWHGMYVRADIAALMALPPPGPPLRVPWALLYGEGARMWRSIACDHGCGMAWLRAQDPYVVAEPTPGGLSPECAAVRHVCWLEVNASWPGVTGGRYAVVWRLKLDKPGSHSYDFPLTVDVDVVGGRGLRTGAELSAADVVVDIKAAANTSPPAGPSNSHAPPGAAAHNASTAAAAAGPSTASGVAAGHVAGATGAAAGQQQEVAGVGEEAQQQQEEAAAAAEAAAIDYADYEDGDDEEEEEEQGDTPPGEGVVRVVHLTLPPARIKQLQGNYGRDWVLLEVGQLQIKEGVSARVRTRLHNTSTLWKAGITFDCVALRPLGRDSGITAESDAAWQAHVEQPEHVARDPSQESAGRASLSATGLLNTIRTQCGQQ